ncbi:MAG: YEATS-associated helix-containing protein [Reichenbachiella sp.]|uniref:YEATS-associated helix-containing protein n=1 Tax=Reichenbachiella sp. TaxID=2184521 RepID=UPI003263B897
MNHLDIHLLTLISIIAVVGAFGGLLNYLHNFDTVENDQKNKYAKYRYIFLGIGAAILVPLFLKMISSNLIEDTPEYNNSNYLIFAGFCLITAIFSRRFINTLGEKILEAAKNAEKTSKDTKAQIESAQMELTTAQERIEDVRVAVNMNNVSTDVSEQESMSILLGLVNSFIEKTSIPDYAERLKLKAELGRRMGQIIATKFDLQKNELLNKHPKEGMYLALAYSVDLRPDSLGVSLLNKLAKVSSQHYTKYVILLAYRTLASSGWVNKHQAKEVSQLITKFRIQADKALLRNIDDTISVLKFIEPEI